MPKETKGKEKKLKAIGSFCTDIEKSVDRIDTYGNKAFEHHAAYIEKVAEAYGEQLKMQKSTQLSLKTQFRKSNFWIPGDALWGLVLKDFGKSDHDSIVISFTRILNACALGLSEAYNKALKLGIEQLKIRAAMIAGQVFGKELEDLGTVVHSGMSLNACGRLQQKAGSDYVILGFILPESDREQSPLVNLNLGIPVIEFYELEDHQDDIKKEYEELRTCKPACKLIVDVVKSDEGNRYVRFFSWPEEIRGIKKCWVIASKVKIEFVGDPNSRGVRLSENRIKGSKWYRVQSRVKNRSGNITLEELIDLLPQCPFELHANYKGDRAQVQIPHSPNQDFHFYFKGQRGVPRAGLKGKRTHHVDFQQDRFCYLPLENVTNRDTSLLIKSNITDDKKSLIFTEVSNNLRIGYDDLSDFVDSSGVCFEFIFD